GESATVTAVAGSASATVTVEFGGNPATCSIADFAKDLDIGDNIDVVAVFKTAAGNKVPDGIEVVSAFGRSVFACTPYLGGALGEQDAGGQLLAPMMGKVVAVKAAAGAAVAAGQTVIVLESMKMELHVSAPFDGSVASIRCAVGDMVERHQALAEVIPVAAS
ncbi:MAG TPA: acetyl-CoA carboxylase biotin carboxyl carrier protein subunit, partial [Rubrivivax sp.]|nr:acetyl-CoA carboxylase biotin carboxyl carrier protein subunit [Rubrivivax sp.]